MARRAYSARVFMVARLAVTALVLGAAVPVGGAQWRGADLSGAGLPALRRSSAARGRRLLDLTPPGSMIDPRELRVAVLTYLRAPERRAEFASPVDPRGAVVLPPGHAGGEAVQRGAEA